MQRVLRSVLAVTAFLAMPGTLVGQVGIAAGTGGTWTDRPLFDYFVSRYSIGGGGQEQDAVGGRLMWSLASIAGGRGRLIDRTLVGGYLIHSPDERGREEAWRYGAQADLRIAPSRFAWPIDPIVSLGLGALQSQERPNASAEAREAASGLLLPPQTRTSLSVAPGVGLRLRLFSGIGVRGDARQVIDFGDGLRRNVEFSGGLSLGV